MSVSINEPRFVAFPREMLTGVLTESADTESIAADLAAAGVLPKNIGFLSGEEGLRILNPDGNRGTLRQRVQRKIEHFVNEGEVLERVAGALRSGKTVLGVFDVKQEDAERLRDVCKDNGVGEIHYFGRWKID